MNNRIFNSDVEIGLRCLFILKALYPNFCTLERILYLDYLSIYIEDYKLNSTNLHPKYPFQSIEVFEKIQVLKQSVLKLSFKGLIDVEIENGLQYRANGNTSWLIDNIQSNYSIQLVENIKLIIEDTKFKTDQELKNIIFSPKQDNRTMFDNFYPYLEEV